MVPSIDLVGFSRRQLTWIHMVLLLSMFLLLMVIYQIGKLSIRKEKGD